MIAGVVLAGGQSLRFGADKASTRYRGRKLIDWSLATLARHADLVFVSGRHHPDHESVADIPRTGLGPLGGLAGALVAAEARGFTHLLSIPCDTPHVPNALFQALRATNGPAYAEACPVIGVWPTTLAACLADYLERDLPRAVQAWCAYSKARSIRSLEPIANINHVAELGALESQYG